MVTDDPYCDFVLHSKMGNPSIERIDLDDLLAKNIDFYAREFWERVYIPEYFLMRVPRNLNALDIESSEIDFVMR